MLPTGNTYEQVAARFRWRLPARCNIGVDVCDRHAALEPGRLALVEVDDTGHAREFSFGELRALSNRLANLLAHHGVVRGDRVGILLPQRWETACAHIAVYKLGAIAVPLFTLFGADALIHRLGDSAARLVISDAAGAARLAGLRDRLPDLEAVLCADGDVEQASSLAAGMARATDRFTPLDTTADQPALIIYTSGTTGAPKGALHAQRVLAGHLPGVELSHDLFPQPGDRIWTPADWAWIGGLLDVLLPALYHGVPVVTRRFPRFDPDAAFDLMRVHGVRNAFLPPTALKLMRAARPVPTGAEPRLRSVASGGETLGTELLAWGREVLGVTVNEFYGQTECNMIVSSCAALMAPRPGVMGRPVPGHRVEVIDATGQPRAEGETGAIAVGRPDPVMFLGYWHDEAATRARFIGDWMLTGDTGQRETGGWIRFIGRDDDLITSAGYRIGPGEIEDCLLRHPAVRMAGVVGKPDPLRTEVVKAYVVLQPGIAGSQTLAAEIADWVRTRLAAHEYPGEVEFIDDLPLTTTGKIVRRELRDRARREPPR